MVAHAISPGRQAEAGRRGRRCSFRGDALRRALLALERAPGTLSRYTAAMRASAWEACAAWVGTSFLPADDGRGALRQLASGDGGGGFGLLSEEAARLRYRRFQRAGPLPLAVGRHHDEGGTVRGSQVTLHQLCRFS